MTSARKGSEFRGTGSLKGALKMLLLYQIQRTPTRNYAVFMRSFVMQTIPTQQVCDTTCAFLFAPDLCRPQAVRTLRDSVAPCLQKTAPPASEDGLLPCVSSIPIILTRQRKLPSCDHAANWRKEINGRSRDRTEGGSTRSEPRP